MHKIPLDDCPFYICEGTPSGKDCEPDCTLKKYCEFLDNKELSIDFFQKMCGFMNAVCIETGDDNRLSNLLVQLKIADSISDGNRLIKQGAVKLNLKQEKDIKKQITQTDCFENKWMLITSGKSSAGIVLHVGEC